MYITQDESATQIIRPNKNVLVYLTHGYHDTLVASDSGVTASMMTLRHWVPQTLGYCIHGNPETLGASDSGFTSVKATLRHWVLQTLGLPHTWLP